MIGPRHRHQLRHITVAHPALAYLAQASISAPFDYEIIPDRAYGSSSCSFDPQWVEARDPTSKLLELSDLSRLTFLLSGYPTPQLYQSLGVHQATKTKWRTTLPTTRTSMVNIVSVVSMHAEPSYHQFLLNDLYSENQLADLARSQCRLTYIDAAQYARVFFRYAAYLGWKIEEVYLRQPLHLPS